MSNLDDLFSKRDKKKKTTKTKFSTLDANEFAKQLEASSSSQRNYEDNDNDYQYDMNYGNSTNSNDNLDEEWKPFDSEDNKDYTGLKIIQNWKAEDGDDNYSNQNEYGDKKNKFVWGSTAPKPDDNEDNKDDENEKKSETAVNQEADSAAVPEAAPVTDSKENDENKDPAESAADSSSAPASGAYVPPALRRAQQQSSATSAPAEKPVAAASTEPSKYVPPHMRGKTGTDSLSSSSAIPSSSVNYRRPNPAKAQPNILDTLEFPTLDNAPDASASDAAKNADSKLNGNEKFEAPKKGGRIEPKTNEKMIDLDNKFNALSTNQ